LQFKKKGKYRDARKKMSSGKGGKQGGGGEGKRPTRGGRRTRQEQKTRGKNSGSPGQVRAYVHNNQIESNIVVLASKRKDCSIRE